MGRIRRGGYQIYSWKGDHLPRHVHVWFKGEFLAKWDVENWQILAGEVSGRLLRILECLRDEGLL